MKGATVFAKEEQSAMLSMAGSDMAEALKRLKDIQLFFDVDICCENVLCGVRSNVDQKNP